MNDRGYKELKIEHYIAEGIRDEAKRINGLPWYRKPLAKLNYALFGFGAIHRKATEEFKRQLDTTADWENYFFQTLVPPKNKPKVIDLSFEGEEEQLYDFHSMTTGPVAYIIKDGSNVTLKELKDIKRADLPLDLNKGREIKKEDGSVAKVIYARKPEGAALK